MSLDLINHKLTTSTTDENGVIWWENPAVSVKISSKGGVFSLRRNKPLEPTDKNLYNVGIKFARNPNCPYAFNSLFSRIVLGEKLKARTLILKDESKGYVVGNTDTIPCNQSLTYHGAKTPKQPKLNEVAIEMKETNQTKEKTMEQYFTVYEAKNEHITEDGAVFPTRELAEWHQTNVSKGKGNAQVVLDYNGGFVLAEQIYLQEVVYNKAKPYLHFTDVLNNNKGVVSNVQEEHCKFDKLDSEHGFRSEVCFMTLRKQLPEQVSKHQALKIQGALERYSDSVKALNESIVGLEALLKQVK